MPRWTLHYRIGLDCTEQDLYHEQHLLQNDAACVNYESEQSWSEPGLVHVRVEFGDWISISPQTNAILRLRNGEAIPAVPMFPARTEVLMDFSEPQEGARLQIGSQVCIDENGRIGANGAPIGILTRLDESQHTAQIAIYGSGGGPSPLPLQVPLQVSRLVPDNSGNYRVVRDSLPGIFTDRIVPTPLPAVSNQIMRMREQAAAAEDARVFEALDALGAEPAKPRAKAKPKPAEPRPVTKSRYERIMDSFEPEK